MKKIFKNYKKSILLLLGVIVGAVIGLVFKEKAEKLINNKIVEKPKSIEEAKQNLRNSSNNTTKIITGITIINKDTNQVINEYQQSIVTFKEIKEQDIEYYVENEKDALYASGFILETYCSNFIRKIEGSYYNILGVPVEKIYEILNQMNIYLKDINN